MLARHRMLKPTARFLHTTSATSTLVYPDDLVNPSPIPLNRGPTKEAIDRRPLYFVSDMWRD